MVRRMVPSILILGDALAILVVTWIGFLTHGESLLNPRWLTTFVPAATAWGLLAPWLGVYRPDTACRPSQLWRPVLAALLSAPLAGVFRSLLLNSVVLPVFVGVLGLTNAAGLALWRMLYLLFLARSEKKWMKPA